MSRKPPRLAIAAAAVLLLVSLGGCAGLGMAPPELSLVDLQFTDLTMFETTGVFTVRILNENPDPLTIDGGVFKVYLNGLKVGKGVSSARLEIPRLESVTTDVSLRVSNVALAARLADLLEKPVLDYTLKSKLFVVRPYGTRGATFSHEGRIDLRGKGAAPGLAPAAVEDLGE